MSATSSNERDTCPLTLSRWGWMWPLLTLVASCQTIRADASHEILDTLTALGQPAYELVAAWCSSEQWAIVADEAISIQEKSQKIAAVRKQCHGLYDAFEVFIQEQHRVRELVEAVETGRSGDDVAYKAVIKLRQKLISIQAMSMEVIHGINQKNSGLVVSD
jgi:hypothetical protein